MRMNAVIFDLDGVIVSTDEYHYLAWKKMSDQEEIPFDREVNNRLRGVSRRESLEIILENSNRSYREDEKIELAERKNRYYQELLRQVNPDDLLPGVTEVLACLKQNGIRTAIGSSSRNARLILGQTGMLKAFDAIADGNDIARSKPDPEVFLLAAARLGVSPAACVVVEDAVAGIEAAHDAGMLVVGVGPACAGARVHEWLKDLTDFRLESLKYAWEKERGRI